MFGELFKPEDAGSTFLQDVGLFSTDISHNRILHNHSCDNLKAFTGRGSQKIYSVSPVQKIVNVAELLLRVILGEVRGYSYLNKEESGTPFKIFLML